VFPKGEIERVSIRPRTRPGMVRGLENILVSLVIFQKKIRRLVHPEPTAYLEKLITDVCFLEWL